MILVTISALIKPMTFILGINLTDRLYLASDTKISRKMPDGSFQALAHSMKLISFVGNGIEESVSCAFSGDVSFAKFLMSQMSKDFGSKLVTDIVTLNGQIGEYFEGVVKQWPYKNFDNKPCTSSGENIFCQFIFGGVQRGALNRIDFGHLSNLLGPEAGQINDINLVNAMPLKGVIPGVVYKSIFSVVVGTRGVEVGELGPIYSVIANRSPEDNAKMLKELFPYFKDKRPILDEARDIINYIRNHYNEVVGGGVVLGYIDEKERLINVGYDIDRKGKISDKNWSLEGPELKLVDPYGKKTELKMFDIDWKNTSNADDLFS